jgi:hypothetical protein
MSADKRSLETKKNDATLGQKLNEKSGFYSEGGCEMNENEMKTDIRTREIKPRREGDPLATRNWNNQWYSEEEYKELQRRYMQSGKDMWEQTEQGKLCLAFYEAFHAYRKYLEKNAFARSSPHGHDVDYDEHMLFEEGLRMVENLKLEREETLRRNLEKAQKAARCRHRYLNGRQCGAPRVKGRKLCHMHERVEEAKMAIIDLGPMEDADSIQMGIRKLQAAIVEGKLSHRQIAQLAYTIQLAAWNVTRTSVMAEKLE